MFPCLLRVTRFPAFVIGYRFSRACFGLLVFPRLPPVTRFPRLLQVSVSHFPAHVTGFNLHAFSRACHRFIVFPQLSPVTSFFLKFCLFYSNLFVKSWRVPYLGTTAFVAHLAHNRQKKTLEQHPLITKHRIQISPHFHGFFNFCYCPVSKNLSTLLQRAPWH